MLKKVLEERTLEESKPCTGSKDLLGTDSLDLRPFFLLKCENFITQLAGKTRAKRWSDSTKPEKDDHPHAHLGVEMTSLQKPYEGASGLACKKKRKKKYPAFTSLCNRAGSFSEGLAEEG